MARKPSKPKPSSKGGAKSKSSERSFTKKDKVASKRKDTGQFDEKSIKRGTGGFGGGDSKPFERKARSFDSAPERKTYGDRERKPRAESAKLGYGDADRKPRSFGKDAAERKPYERKPRTEGDSERKPYERKSFGGDADRKPRSFDAGSERKPYERKPRTEGDSERKPYERKSTGGADRKPRSFDAGSERKPYERKPRTEGDSERKPYERKSTGGADRKPRSFDAGSERKPYERKPRTEGGSDRKPFERKSYGGDSERKPYKPGAKFPGADRKKSYGDAGSKSFNAHKAYERKAALEQKKKDEDYVDDGSTRLNKYVSNAGICSRREADVLIKSGAVKVNGKIVTEMGYKVMPGDVVNYGGESLSREKPVYMLMNKPKDYITTTDDPKERKTVMNLLNHTGPERLYPVGRLDRNTTGLLLFTNDGEMARKLTHPSSRIKKIYHVYLDKNLQVADYQQISEGFELEDGFIKPDVVEYVSGAEDKKQIGVEIHSGRNRIVRRMFEHFGYVVVKLDRVTFAGLTKKDLARGRTRYLSEKEIGMLKML